MADIDVIAGLAVKADANQLYADVVGSLAKFKEDRRFNKVAYEELLEKYASAVSSLEGLRNQINDLIEEAQAKKLPEEAEVKTIGALAELMGAKNQDGSLDLKKLAELKQMFDKPQN